MRVAHAPRRTGWPRPRRAALLAFLALLAIPSHAGLAHQPPATDPAPSPISPPTGSTHAEGVAILLRAQAGDELRYRFSASVRAVQRGSAGKLGTSYTTTTSALVVLQVEAVHDDGSRVLLARIEDLSTRYQRPECDFAFRAGTMGTNAARAPATDRQRSFEQACAALAASSLRLTVHANGVVTSAQSVAPADQAAAFSQSSDARTALGPLLDTQTIAHYWGALFRPAPGLPKGGRNVQASDTWTTPAPASTPDDPGRQTRVASISDAQLVTLITTPTQSDKPDRPSSTLTASWDARAGRLASSTWERHQPGTTPDDWTMVHETVKWQRQGRE